MPASPALAMPRSRSKARTPLWATTPPMPVSVPILAKHSPSAARARSSLRITTKITMALVPASAATGMAQWAISSSLAERSQPKVVPSHRASAAAMVITAVPSPSVMPPSPLSPIMAVAQPLAMQAAAVQANVQALPSVATRI